MRTSLIALWVLIFSDEIIAMKVRERLLKYKSPGYRCRWGVDKRGMAFPEAHLGIFFKSIYKKLISQAIRLANCTEVDIKMTFYKIPDENGTYDGYVGLIQRNEIDTGFFDIRPDSLPYEPGKITPPMESAEITIATSKKPAALCEYDLMKFLYFGKAMYLFCFINLFFVCPLLFVYVETKRELRHVSGIMVRGYLKNCFNMFSLIVDQEQFKPSRAAGYIIALSASLFTLFAIHGVLLTTVGADLVVREQPPVVDSLDDLLASDLIPMVTDNMFAHHILKSSPAGSKENKLWFKMQKQGQKSIIKVDTADEKTWLSSMARLSEKITQRKAAPMGPIFIADFLSVASCVFLSVPLANIKRLSETLHIARETVAPGIMTSLMSHKIHPYTERVVSYLFTNTYETGQVIGMKRFSKYSIHQRMPIPGGKYDSTTIQCVEKSGHSEKDFQPFPLDKMRGLLLLLSCSFVASFYILLLELYWQYFGGKISNMIVDL